MDREKEKEISGKKTNILLIIRERFKYLTSDNSHFEHDTEGETKGQQDCF